MAIEKISENKRKQIINKSVNPLPNNPSKAGYKADEIKKAMFNFVTDEKDSVVDEINRIVDETNASFDDINNTNQETSKTIESINKTIKQINDTVSNKVDKEEGKHLSSNDFSSEEKEKLAKLNNYDDSEVRAGIDEINSKISAQASSTNQLADKDFVNSSIETATATFKGTFEDLNLLKTTPADNNDYAFYDHISNSNRVFDRYKFNGTEWVYEFTLNNSSFTDAQWKAINSGATAELINKILTNADNINTILNTLNNIDTKLNNTVDKSSAQDISGLKNFTERPTVNNKEVALKTDIAESSGTTVFVKGDPVTEFNADDKLDKTANAVSATKATQDGDGNTITDTYVEKWSQAAVLTGRTYNLNDLFYENRDGRFICHTLEDANNCSHKPEENVNGFTLESHFIMKGENHSYRTYIQNYESVNGKWFRTSSQEGTGIEPVWSEWKKLVTPDDNVVSATKATEDGDGNVISSSYIKNFKIKNVTNHTLGNSGGWDSASYGTNIPSLNTIAYWDGRYADDMTKGNLAYCNKGAFGDMATKNSANYTLKTDNMISAYGTCSTAAGTAAKVVTIADANWTLKVGTVIGVKFTAGNTASNVTLNVNSTGAKSIYYNNAKYTGNSQTICGYANRLVYYMYDGTYWVWFSTGVELNDNNVPSAISWTASGTQAKTATCHSYSLLAKSYTQVMMHNANTYAGAITMNINGTGAKPIYINGVASSSSNYTLPAGSYFVYYNGTNYYFRTDGVITGNITGWAGYATSSTTQGVNENSTKIATTAWVRSYICPAGTVMAFAGSTTPSGWLLCDGSAVSRTTYSALYSAIGTTYGTSSSTTFNLPQLTDNRFIEGSSSSGTKNEAGIPNIQGKFAYAVRDGGREGAFSWGSIDENKVGSGSSYDTKQGIFNASLGDTGKTKTTTSTYTAQGDSVYGKSPTVQPKSLTMRYIIKY